MGLTKYKLGELVEIVDERNDLGIRDFYGINKSKEFMPTVANTTNLDESKYKIVRKNRFVFSGMQTGRDKSIRLVMYTKNNPIIVSPAYITFEIKEKAQVIPLYFFMIFLSEEKDRLGWFLSDASIRANLDWEVFCDIEINLPSIEIQKKYVAIYEAMLENQRAYEEGLEDLKLACDGTIEKLKHNSKKRMLGDFIIETNIKNENGSIKKVLGVESTGNFMRTRAKMKGVNIKNYSVVNKNDFAYNPSRINLGSIARYEDEDSCIISPMYTTFKIVSKTLNPLFLSLWFSRKEFHRYTWYYSTGSVRDLFDINLMKEVYLPYPDISIQNSIANIYKVYTERKEINEKLKEQIKSICPILIKGAIEEADREEA